MALGAGPDILFCDLTQPALVQTIAPSKVESNNPKTHENLAFSADGSTLMAVHQDGDRVVTVSLADGSVAETMLRKSTNATGPPILGPVPGTLYLPFAQPYQGDTNGATWYWDAKTGGGNLIDVQTGLPVLELPADRRPVRRLADGRLLRLEPDVPTGQAIAIANDDADAQTYREKMPEIVTDYITNYVEKNLGTPLPEILETPDPIDRSGIQLVTATAPAKWSVPAPGPALERSQTSLNLPRMADYATRQALGIFDTRGDTFATRGFDWFRFDRKTGAAMGEPVRMTESFQTKLLAARADEQLIALQSKTPTRVELRDATGTRSALYEPFRPRCRKLPKLPIWRSTPTDGCSSLATGGYWRSIPKPAKRVYEIDGTYRAPMLFEPDRRWVVVPSKNEVLGPSSRRPPEPSSGESTPRASPRWLCRPTPRGWCWFAPTMPKPSERPRPYSTPAS